MFKRINPYIILTEEIEHEEFKDITFHSVIGYRYQKKERHNISSRFYTMDCS